MKDEIFKVKSFYPPMIINISDKTYILPVWLRVPNGTTLNQIKWEKEIPAPKSQPNLIEVDSSSGGGKYQIQKVGKITNTWKRALQQIRSNQLNEAIETLDECLMILALATEDNTEDLDGVSIDLWKTRVWVKLEDLDAVPAYDQYI